MKIDDLCSELDITVVAPPVDGQITVSKVITGDLLSFIMGHAVPGSMWLTVQNHLNVAAVAVLKELPIILLTSGREPSGDLAQKCREEGICLCRTSRSTFSVIADLVRQGFEG